MAITFSGSVRAGISWSYKSTSAIAETENSAGFSFADSLATGTAADQADRLYVAQVTIAASGTLNLDLAGALTDVFGNSITFARVKAFFLVPAEGNLASEVSVGGHATAAAPLWFSDATDKEKVHKTGVCFHYRADATAWPVTATTADMLSVINLDATNAATLNVAIVGCSA